MKYANIRLWKDEIGNGETYLAGVKVLRRFMMFGEQFFAHHLFGKRGVDERYYVVSEFKTGFKTITNSEKRMSDAIAKARERMEGIGEEKVKSTIAKEAAKNGIANTGSLWAKKRVN